jgi:hypothetical protein
MYVPTLVFAGAPIVNAIVALLWHPPEISPGPRFWIGLIMAAVGAGLVLFEKGHVEDLSRKLKTQMIAGQQNEPASPNVRH